MKTVLAQAKQAGTSQNHPPDVLCRLEIIETTVLGLLGSHWCSEETSDRMAHQCHFLHSKTYYPTPSFSFNIALLARTCQCDKVFLSLWFQLKLRRSLASTSFWFTCSYKASISKFSLLSEPWNVTLSVEAKTAETHGDSWTEEQIMSAYLPSLRYSLHISTIQTSSRPKRSFPDSWQTSCQQKLCAGSVRTRFTFILISQPLSSK